MLKGLDESVKQAAGAGWNTFVDLKTGQSDDVSPHSQSWFAAYGVATKMRPDLVLVKSKVDGEVDRVVVVELSVQWEAEAEGSWAREEDEWAKAAGWTWKNTVEKRLDIFDSDMFNMLDLLIKRLQAFQQLQLPDIRPRVNR